MKKIYIFLIAISFVGSFLGCSLISGKEDAETVAESFMEDRIAHGGFAGHDTYYGDIFWQHAKEEDWQRVQQMVDIALGDLNSYSLLTSNTQSKFHTNELSGTFVTLVYNTEYEKGNGLETLTMYKGLKDKDFRIIGQHVNSPKIQELIYKGIEQVSGQ
ncbi:MAG: hypothetical protein PVH15_10595 [Syntrophobacterales bacterium]|jgi:hypothetical protein